MQVWLRLSGRSPGSMSRLKTLAGDVLVHLSPGHPRRASHGPVGIQKRLPSVLAVGG